MPLIFVVGALLVVFIVGAVVYNAMSSGYRSTIDRMTLEIAGLETDKASLLEQVQLLERQLDNVSAEVERKDMEIQRLVNESKFCKVEEGTGGRTVEQVLLDSGAITEAVLDKARRYVEKTGVKRELHEVLVMLGMVAPQEVLGAKRTLGRE